MGSTLRRINKHLCIDLGIEAAAPVIGHRFTQANLANTGDDCDNARARL